MPFITYKGLNTNSLYRFAALSQVAAYPVDSLGRITIAGEQAVLTTRDGAPLRGTAGAPPATDLYAASWAPSVWEKSTVNLNQLVLASQVMQTASPQSAY